MKQGKLSASLFEPRKVGKPCMHDTLFARTSGAVSDGAPKPARQTASDRKWEGIAWISPEELAMNVDKRPRKPVPTVDVEAVAGDAGAVVVVAEATTSASLPLVPKPADPVSSKDMEQRRRDKDRIPSEQTWEWSVPSMKWLLVMRRKAMEIGIFFSYSPIPGKQAVLLKWLVTDNETSALTADFLRRHVIPRLNRTHPVSLRLLDWLVVDYAREKGTAYRRFFPHIGQYRLVVVYSLYFEWLTRWRRRHYDVFRRRHRIYFTIDGQTYSTTVAQLHFFYMAELYGFLDFAQENAVDIEAHMQMKLGITNDIKRKAAESGEKYRRRPLVNKCPPKAYISQGDFLLTFQVGGGDDEEEAVAEEEEEEEEDASLPLPGVGESL
jgi:hypothetical protein